MKTFINKSIVALIALILSFTFFGKAEAQSYSRTTVDRSVENEITLNGSINPAGEHTTAWFEWGMDPNLRTWNETTHVYVGATNYSVPISVSLDNLSPNTTYYFRVVSDNSRNIIKGNIMSFNTTSIGRSRVTTENRTSGSGDSISIRNRNYQRTSNLTAGPIFASSGLPTTLAGWLILILVIVAIIAVFRRLVAPHR
jgi:hypothetical protein